MWDKNHIEHIRVVLRITVCVNFFLASFSVVSAEPIGLNHSPPPGYMELLKAYAAPGEKGGVLACSKKLCERVGIPITKDKVLNYDGELGVEFYVESVPAIYIHGRVIPPGFNCRVEFFSPLNGMSMCPMDLLPGEKYLQECIRRYWMAQENLTQIILGKKIQTECMCIHMLKQ